MPNNEACAASGSMEDARLLRFWQRFTDYARTFARPDGSLAFPDQLKVDHTFDVCAIIHQIMMEEDSFAPEAIFRADTAALFHDVSRFEQYQKFHTFRDAVSFDHGDRSAELIRELNLVPELTDAELREIAESIRIHNKLMIPADFPQEYLHTAQLIRDADKLSILKVILRFFAHPELASDPTVKLDLPKTPGYSKDVLEKAFAGIPIPHAAMHNVNDFLILLFTWSGDLHYRASYAYVQTLDLYGQLRKLLPSDPEFDQLLEHTRLLISKQIAGESK